MENNFINEEIDDQERYLEIAKKELHGLGELSNAFSLFSSGFLKLLFFIESIKENTKERIRSHEERIKTLKKDLK